MKTRRPCRMRLNGLVIREVQRQRLVRIARGEIEPNCDREEFFQWSVLEGCRPRCSDFILPPMLWLWEQEEAEDAAGDVPADVTAS